MTKNNGISWNGIFQRSLDLSIARLISVATTFIIIAIAARHYSIIEYSEYRKALLAIEIIAPLIALGLPQAVYFLLAQGRNARKLLVSSLGLILGSSLLTLLIVLAMSLTSYKSSLSNEIAKNYLLFIALYALLDSFCQLCAPFLVTAKRTNIIARSTILASGTTLLLLLIIIRNDSNAYWIVAARATASTVNFGILLWFTLKESDKSNEKYNVSYLRFCLDSLAASIPLMLAGLVGTLSQALDRLIVSQLATSKEFATYATGAFEVPLIGIVVGSLSTIILAEMSKSIAKRDLGTAHTLFSEAANKVALVIFPAFALLWINAELLITLIFGAGFQESATYFQAYLLLLPCRIVVYGTALVALGLNRTILYRSLGELIINLALSLILYPHYGPLGVAIATIMSVYLWSVALNLRTIARGFQVPMRKVLDFKRLSMMLVIAFIPLGAASFSQMIHPVFEGNWIKAGVSICTLPFVAYGFKKLHHLGLRSKSGV